MHQSVARAGGWPAAVLALAAALGAGCPGGKDGGETAETAECVPGYGTLSLSFVMADEYSESVRDEFDDIVYLRLYHAEQVIESCQDYDYSLYERITGLRTSLDLAMDFQVPAGQTCGDIHGTVKPDAEHYLDCDGDMALTEVPECERVEAAMPVTCILTDDEPGED